MNGGGGVAMGGGREGERRNENHCAGNRGTGVCLPPKSSAVVHTSQCPSTDAFQTAFTCSGAPSTSYFPSKAGTTKPRSGPGEAQEELRLAPHECMYLGMSPCPVLRVQQPALTHCSLPASSHPGPPSDKHVFVFFRELLSTMP